jgi:hypothetical protein
MSRCGAWALADICLVVAAVLLFSADLGVALGLAAVRDQTLYLTEGGAP